MVMGAGFDCTFRSHRYGGICCQGRQERGLGENPDCDTRSHALSELVEEVFTLRGHGFSKAI